MNVFSRQSGDRNRKSPPAYLNERLVKKVQNYRTEDVFSTSRHEQSCFKYLQSKRFPAWLTSSSVFSRCPRCRPRASRFPHPSLRAYCDVTQECKYPCKHAFDGKSCKKGRAPIAFRRAGAAHFLTRLKFEFAGHGFQTRCICLNILMHKSLAANFKR